MFRKLALGAAVLFAALGIFISAPARADIISFDFAGSDGSGTLTAVGTLDVVAGQALSGTGTISTTDLADVVSDTISLVTLSTPDVANLGGGNLSYRFGGGTDLIGDTVFPPDNKGLVFIDTTSSNDVGFNLWWNGGDSYTGFVASNSDYRGYNGTLTTAEVPEPMALPLLGTSIVLLGFFSTWRNRKGIPAQARAQPC